MSDRLIDRSGDGLKRFEQAGGGITTDYLVKGAGAVAMAFVDTLLSQSSDDIVMVDCHDHPGGHWNDAYPFVHLHQPSAFYGVASEELGRSRVMPVGLNVGLHELASRDEILAYYDRVMRDRFLASGRVRWFPSSELVLADGDTHRIKSILSGAELDVVVCRKFVDATLTAPKIPLTSKPPYDIAAGIAHIPINGLSRIRRPHPCYTVIGSGKTGVDACLWLLGNNVLPERIRWIAPRDFWMLNRADLQPSPEKFEHNVTREIAKLQCIADATSISHLFRLFERGRHLLRLTVDVEPTGHHCATVTEAEVHELRRIVNIVRIGRVAAIESSRLILERGTLDADPDTLYIDCTAAGFQPPPDVAVFDGLTINPVWIRGCQPAFSAAFIAFVETQFSDNDQKNALCNPVIVPQLPRDWLVAMKQTADNQREWAKYPEVMKWVDECRLSSQHAVRFGIESDDPHLQPLLARRASLATEAADKLRMLLARTEGEDAGEQAVQSSGAPEPFGRGGFARNRPSRQR